MHLLYHAYSGHLFFSAAALFLAATAADFAGLRIRRIAALLALLAIPLAGLSGTPVPIALAIAVLIATLAYTFIGFGARPSLRYPLGTAAIIAVVLVCAVELPFHLRLPHVRASRLFVIGDSLSSGGFGEQVSWPAILRATNLALPSDTAMMALQNQIPLLPPPVPGDCVIIEIGGNDMFEGAQPAQFAKALDGMLGAARAGGQRTVLLLELPLLPGRWRYGAIQRRLAAKHGVALIPKRVLAGALLGRGNTSDGIHLLQPGHDALARDLGSIFDRGERTSRPQSPGVSPGD